MGKPDKEHYVSNEPILSGSASTATPSPSNVTTKWPQGRFLARSIDLRAYGNLNVTVATTNIAGGQLNFLRQILIKTDKHGIIVDNVDALSLYRIAQVVGAGSGQGQAPALSDAATGVAVNPFSCEIPIRLADPLAIRQDDLSVQVLTAKMESLCQFGPGSALDFVSAGTAVVQDYNHEWTLTSLPEFAAADLPIMAPYYFLQRVSITATATGFPIPLPYNDRIYRRLWLFQRTVVANVITEVSSIITATARINLKLNGYPWRENIQFKALQDRNARTYGLGPNGMPTGMACLDFAKPESTGYQLSNCLNAVDDKNGSLSLEPDVTSVAGGQLYIVGECAKPMPAGAVLKPEQLA